MATCNGFSASSSYFFSSLKKTNFSILNPRSKPFRVACTSSVNDQKRNITNDSGPSLKECSFSEKNWERKKEEVRLLLLQHASTHEDKDGLVLVDAIQRVGIDHLFYDEIDMILKRQYYATNGRCYNDNLYDVSLYFRLLRQQGYYISSDVFNNFKCNDGKFKEQLKEDIRGLMELYEASQLSFKGEYIIDEAEEFSRVNLNFCMENMNENWYKEAIKNTLRLPQHKIIAKCTIKDSFIGGFIKGCKGWETFLDLAKMDFHMAESLHHVEFLQYSQWWKDLGLYEELQRARNLPVEWYMWAVVALINYPNLSFARLEFAKVTAMLLIIDDIFDVYGRLDELTILTQAINRWDYCAIDTLPEYMKSTYKALLDTTNELAQNVEKKHGYNPIHSFKETWASLCNAFLLEARWIQTKESPRAKEYLKNAEVTIGVHMLLDHLFYFLGNGGAADHLFQLNSVSNLKASSATIIRLWNDVAAARYKRKENDMDASYIKYYRNEVNLSMEEAEQHVMDLISNEWKIINEECFHLNHSSASSFKRASLNLPRMHSLLYTSDENVRFPLPRATNT